MVKKLIDIGSGIVIAVELVVILLLIVTKISGGIPSVLGYNMYVIVSPSMTPELEVGDVIISKEYDGGDLSVGDVIQYAGTTGDMAGKIITHKIIRIEGEGRDATIVTQGVANPEPDPPIRGSDVLAVMTYKTVVIGKIYAVVSTTAGFILLVMLPMAALIVAEIVSLAKSIREEKEKGGEENGTVD